MLNVSYIKLFANMVDVLLFVKYDVTMQEEQGESDANYGKTTNQMVDRRADCHTTRRARSHSPLLDTKQEASSVQVWQEAQGQRRRLGEVYRAEQNRRVNKNSGPSQSLFSRRLANGP